MSEELLIEQPQGGVWLSPGKRLGHLVGIFNCTEKVKAYDEMSQSEKEKATFEFVDLDQERQLIAGYDNHPGVTFKLRVGNPAVVLGRLAEVASARGIPAIVLQEHTPEDAARLRDWYANRNTVRPAAQVPAQTAQTQVRTQPPAPLPAAAPALPPTEYVRPDGAPVPAAAGLDLSKLDAGTLALLQKALGQ